MTTKPKRKRAADEEILARRAHAAWEYRQRNRAVVNEKARVRMQKRREALRHAPSDVQQEANRKARQYRRNYVERGGTQSKPEATQSPPKKIKQKPTVPQQHQLAAPPTAPGPPAPPPRAKLRPAPSPFGSSPGKIADLNLVKPRPPSGSTNRAKTPPTPTPRSRNPRPATPRSLAAIDADDDGADSLEEDSENESEKSDSDEPSYTGHRITSIQRWWEYLDADGPLKNVTGHPDYVPERGQQPYFRGGRRYWF
ncbi:hypothetical protein B0H16DRAFT_1723624 [Mycena metata]|uniref:Uncharacterized protein n=1 Tax=Mycena metata TaxID=1033252 RepID=A0AAD7NB29_9AGAR|nr:hypothetical protein B0H16DRAFT_1723624 [Mycena metata]